MDQVNLGYSTKNIPIPSKKDYLIRFISSTENLIRCTRWRSFFFLNPDIKQETKETFGFKSTRSPPKIPELDEFEEEMLNLVENIEFRSTTNTFQKKLSKDIKDIKQTEHLLIPADKTTNFYKVKQEKYNKLLDENITKNYKKAPQNLEKDIQNEDICIASKLDLDNRIDCTAKNQAFITLKDHKPAFRNKPTCRLINPTKSEIGKISKQILEKINTKIRKTTKFNQWKNTNEVISWFSRIENKQKHSFICFDVCEFYPSISQDLLSEALKFAEKYVNISEDEKSTIAHAKQSLLYNDQTPWCKKGISTFDVTMGSYDGAESCELVGLYILSQLQDLEINVGLYRDDGLAICDKSPKETEHIKKKICEVFKKNKLNITINANMKTIDFLDITMDLVTGIHKPYMKPNNTPLYVHKQSNHPPNIIRNIPESINRRLSTISSNKTEFIKAAPGYQDALKHSGYEFKLQYKPPPAETGENSKRKNNRSRNVTWFNPPYSNSVKTNIGKAFLKLIDKCFPPENPLHKILNRKTVKVSYSCMTNTKQIIANHNKEILRKAEPDPPTKTCNCRQPDNCPLDGKCLTPKVIYQATVKREDNQHEETYVGLTENSFKLRYNNHTCSFVNNSKRTATTLSRHVWKLKDQNIPHSITWRIIDKANSYSPSSKKCNLCTKEKYFIICKQEMATLNSRSELASVCRHRKKHLLCNA